MANKLSANKAFLDFKRLVNEAGWSLAQLRCDEPPTAGLLEAMDHFGLDDWERFVTALELGY
jgi:hypothetical protein